MLKKLAKYGNSTTLVIDKAILELLNMNESSVVKLQTDGKSLIITPVQPEQAQDKKVSYEGQEGVLQALTSMKAYVMKHVTPTEYDNIRSSFQSSADMAIMQKEVAKLWSSDAAIAYASESPNNLEFQTKIAAIAEQYDPVNNYPEYIKAYNLVIDEFYPEINKIQSQMRDIFKKFEVKK